METALRQNRDIATATARIEEYRAEAGVARSPLFPSLTLNGSDSRNKIDFPGFSVPPYTAYRATADLAWELDFWGQVRRGMQAANADLAAQEAAERGAVLSLVSDVATAYLQLLELDQERSDGRADARQPPGHARSRARGATPAASSPSWTCASSRPR